MKGNLILLQKGRFTNFMFSRLNINSETLNIQNDFNMLKLKKKVCMCAKIRPFVKALKIGYIKFNFILNLKAKWPI